MNNYLGYCKSPEFGSFHEDFMLSFQVAIISKAELEILEKKKEIKKTLKEKNSESLEMLRNFRRKYSL